jgi:prepilin-type N-terminal cleavage/methylation domain-containing protein
MRRELHGIRQLRAEGGFTLIEIMIVVALGACLMAFAVFSAGNGLTAFKASSAMDALRARLQVARDTAISRQRDVQLTFVGNNRLRFSVVNPDGTLTQVDELFLEGDTTFTTFAGQAAAPDTWCTNVANGFRNMNGLLTLRFNSDGALVDSATRNIVSGCLYLGKPNAPPTARAVSLFGATGRARTYKWSNNTWVH